MSADVHSTELAKALGDQILAELDAFERKVDLLQRPAIAELQAIIKRYHGRSFGSFERNKRVANRIQELLDRLNVKVKCPKTGKLGVLRCKSAGGTRNGSFEVRIYVDGKRTSSYTSTVLPVFEIASERDYLGSKLDLHAG